MAQVEWPCSGGKDTSDVGAAPSITGLEWAGIGDAGLAVMAIAVVTSTACDLRTRRIPNVVTGSALVGGLAIRLAGGDLPSLTWGMLGALVALVAGTLPYLARRIGAGDVKLVVALGATIGPHATLLLVPSAVAMAAIWTLVIRARRSALMGTHPVGTGWHDVETVPLAPAIGAGAVLALVLVG